MLMMAAVILLLASWAAAGRHDSRDDDDKFTATEARTLGCETFIIVSQQRSGTGYVIRKLNLHPRIYAGDEILDHVKTFKERVEVIEALQRRNCFYKEQDRVGFKWMTNQIVHQSFSEMGQYLEGTDVKLVYLWRRNVLRQYISNRALKEAHLRSEEDSKTAHPTTLEAVSQFSNFKVWMDPATLVKHLDEDLELRAEVKKGYKQYDIEKITVAYEDLVESSPVYNKTWTTLQEFLGVPVVELGDSHLLLIHGDKPLLAPVSNAASVRKTLVALCKSKRRLEFEAVCEEVETAKCLCDPCECVDEPPQKGKRRLPSSSRVPRKKIHVRRR